MRAKNTIIKKLKALYKLRKKYQRMTLEQRARSDNFSLDEELLWSEIYTLQWVLGLTKK